MILNNDEGIAYGFFDEKWWEKVGENISKIDWDKHKESKDHQSITQNEYFIC